MLPIVKSSNNITIIYLKKSFFVYFIDALGIYCILSDNLPHFESFYLDLNVIYYV